MKNTKIMIVEDEIIIAMDVCAKLQELQYEICDMVTSGESAIEKADLGKPDIVLMDINLDGEMDGIEAAEVIRYRYGIPIIFMTSCQDQETIERAMYVSPVECLIKPVEIEDLSGAIEKTMSRLGEVQLG